MPVKPFDSRPFFRDPFFRLDSADASGFATVDTKTLPIIVMRGNDPANGGAIAKRPGQWGQFGVLVRDYEDAFGIGTRPTLQQEWDIDGTVYRVDSIDPQGDVFVLGGLTNQRRQP